MTERDNLKELAAQVTSDLQGDGFFKPVNASYVQDRIERRLLAAQESPSPEADKPTCTRCGKTMTPMFTCQPCIDEIGREITAEIKREGLAAAPAEAASGERDKWHISNIPKLLRDCADEFETDIDLDCDALRSAANVVEAAAQHSLSLIEAGVRTGLEEAAKVSEQYGNSITSPFCSEKVTVADCMIEGAQVIEGAIRALDARQIAEKVEVKKP